MREHEQEHEQEVALEMLLSGWAQQMTLTPDEATEIRAAARRTPLPPTGDLTGDWWRRLFASVTTPVQFATDPRRFMKGLPSTSRTSV